MDRPLAGDLKMDIVIRLAELAAVLPDGAACPDDAKTVKDGAVEIRVLRALLSEAIDLLCGARSGHIGGSRADCEWDSDRSRLLNKFANLNDR